MDGKKNELSAYEASFCKLFCSRAAFGFWKGRVALYAILKALDVGQGDEVILPGYTCVMDVNPIKYLGAKPVYVDIEPVTYNIDVNLLEQKITDRTKVIIAQHTYGYPCRMDTIMEISRRRGISVIEDCCLAFGSRYKQKMAGTFGRAAYFSFQWNKPFTTGIGGMATVNERSLADKIAKICRQQLCLPQLKTVLLLSVQRLVYHALIYPRTNALATSLFRWLTSKRVVVGSSSTCEFVPEMPDDFFMAMSGSQARAGLRQLEKIDDNIAHRKQMAGLYENLLSEVGWPSRKYDKSVMEPVLVRYPVRVSDKAKALAQAARAGIELGSWFESPLHPIKTALDSYDYHLGMCPEAERASKEVVNLPLHPRVSEKTARRTVHFIDKFRQAD